MDIFKWADEHGWAADYMDMHSGYIYHIQNVLDHDTIYVTDSENHLIGIFRRGYGGMKWGEG